VTSRASVTNGDDRYLRLAELSDYSSLSIRTLQRAIADRLHPLTAHHAGRAVLVRKRDFDAWIANRENAAARAVEEIDSGEMTESRRIAMEVRGYPINDTGRRRKR
jgi:hypothetical protein